MLIMFRFGFIYSLHLFNRYLFIITLKFIFSDHLDKNQEKNLTTNFRSFEEASINFEKLVN